MIKLIAIDMDGTLLDSRHQLSPENIEALRRLEKSDKYVVLCTGRPLSGVKPYFEELGLEEDSFAILNNGCSTFYTASWDLLSYHEIALDEVDILYKQLEGYSDVFLTLTTDKHYYVLGDYVPKIVQDDADLVMDKALAITLEDFKKHPEPIFKAMYAGDKTVLDSFEPAVFPNLSQCFHTVRSQEYLFEVLPKNVSKATGLEELAQRLNIKREQIMAIGDQLNDLEMLSYAGLGVAMGNAPESIKSVADAITDTNDNYGVAKAIEQYIFQAQNDI